MSKVISFRVTDQMSGYLEEISLMRAELYNSHNYNLVFRENFSELIKIAIIRLYNETFDYWANEMLPDPEISKLINKLPEDKISEKIALTNKSKTAKIKE